MKDNEELDMLLNEIPHATSVNLQLQQQQQQQNKLHHQQHQNGIHGYGYVLDGNDNVNGYVNWFNPKQAIDGNGNVNGSSSSSLSGRSTTLEEIKPQTPLRNTHYSNEFRSESKLCDSFMERNLLDDSSEYKVDLSEYLLKLRINDSQDSFSNIREYPNVNFQFSDNSSIRTNNGGFNDHLNIRGYPNGNLLFSDRSSIRTNNGYVENNCLFQDDRKCSSDNGGFNDPFPVSMMTWDEDNGPALLGLQERSQIGILSGLSYPNYSNDLLPYPGSSNGSPWKQRREHLRNDESLRNFQFQEDVYSYPKDKIQFPNNFPASTRPYGFFEGVSDVPSYPHLTNPQSTGTTPNSWIPHSLSSGKNGRDIEAFSEGSWIIKESSVNSKRSYLQMDHKKLPCNDKILELDGLSSTRKIPSVCCKNSNSPKLYCSLIMPPKVDSPWGFDGNIYSIAKDQNGCRFLQRKFDEGTPQEIHMIFNEIIDHVVELMVHPFGNYLIQKLLDVCNEEQRTKILITVTSVPNQLVKISLNTHGTRVVQKLIHTLETREQISRVVSALEPGFLHLMKDTNGNHVVQRCLQCLSSEDNKFIFDAAAKFCVDIATHQHGCCVLQKCIDHSIGSHREKLLAEISLRGLFLAQDAFGNYVIQHIVEKTKSPSANATLHSQFLGSYINLSMQKFSSNVVEMCIKYFNEEERSQIVHELLSSPCLEQLVQGAYANYVIHSALEFSKGSLHNALVRAIRPNIAMLKTNPHCKKIYSKVVWRK